MESFNRQLTEVEEFFQRDNTMGERLATSGVLCYAALAGSTPVMDTLIQKGVGRASYKLRSGACSYSV